MTEQHHNQENFSNENVSVSASKKPGCVVSLDVKVSPIATESCYQKACKNVRKEVSLPGFRKGKAPESMILAKYSSAIQDEFVDCTLQTAFNEAVHLCHLEPLKHSVKRPVIHKCSREEGAHITFNYETKIDTPSIDLKSLSFKKAKPSEVTQEQRETALENFRMQFVTYTPVEDRPVQEGDSVDIDVVLQTEPPRTIANHERVRVDMRHMPSWLCHKVIGMHANETCEGLSEKSPNDTSENFEPAPYKATIHAIFTAHLPELNQELADKVKAPSVDALLERIEKQLEHQAKEVAEKENIDALHAFLIEKYSYDIPNSLVDDEIKGRVEHFKKSYPKASQEEINEYTKFITKIAANNIRVFFLLRKLIHEQQITVNEMDIQEEFYFQISKRTATGECDVDFQDKESIENQIRELALGKKARRFLIENASDVV